MLYIELYNKWLEKYGASNMHFIRASKRNIKLSILKYGEDVTIFSYEDALNETID